MRGKAHSDETKAAVMASLMAGGSITEVAKEHNLDVSLVSRWRKQLPDDQLQEVATKKERDFGSLLADYLEETLVTLSAQQRHFRDKTWLSNQSAAELGVLHGIAADKAIRLFEAAESANRGRVQAGIPPVS